MSLIDASYFKGELNIPNTSKDTIAERLNWFIEKLEKQFLNDLLGYEFSKLFLTGIQAPAPEQRWLDLLGGVEYTNLQGRLAKWVGIIPADESALVIDVDSSIAVVVGRGQPFDPAPDANSVTLPPSLVGKKFIVEQRLNGQLREDEYTIVGNTLTLNNWAFSNNDTYFYNVPKTTVSSVSGTVKKSLIANYIYCQWMRDQYTQSSGIGEVVTKAENATVVSPYQKIIYAWNEMFDIVVELMCYLESKQSVYPEWYYPDKHKALNKFWRINSFGI